MATLDRDVNRTPVGGGVSSSDSTVILPLKIDTNGRVLIKLGQSSNVSVTANATAKHDSNHAPTMIGYTGSAIQRVSMSNSNLLVKLT